MMQINSAEYDVEVFLSRETSCFSNCVHRGSQSEIPAAVWKHIAFNSLMQISTTICCGFSSLGEDLLPVSAAAECCLTVLTGSWIECCEGGRVVGKHEDSFHVQKKLELSMAELSIGMLFCCLLCWLLLWLLAYK